MSKIPIAVQLYSVRTDFAEDVPGTLKEVARMGYDGVEFAGYNDVSAADLRKMLDDNGLKAAGTHIAITSLLGDEFDATVEFNKTLGNKFLIAPGLPQEYKESADAWRRTAEIYDEIAEKLKPLGMYTGSHNHIQELTPLDGEVPWDILFGNTKQTVVMQADIGNALHGGVDVIDYIEKYPGRALNVHLKEFAADNENALVGEGDVDWARCFKVCESVGDTEWYVVEQESYPYPPMECIDRCLKTLREMGK